MTKKDYVLIAGVLRATCAPAHVISALADALAADNRLFQPGRFIAAATPPSTHTASTCPHCGSDAIEGDSYDPEGDSITQQVSCLDCDAEWMDVYQLATFTYIHKPAE